MPHQLNYKHLRYFWSVGKTGSLARAAEQLHLTPQSISTQLAELEQSLGVKLLRRKGRGTELTEYGQRVLSFAEEIFAIGDELLADLHDGRQRTLELRVGIADSVSKGVAYELLAPVLALAEPVRLRCSEGRITTLLSELAVHKLDLIIADRPLPAQLNVRGYSHFLGETDTSFLCARTLRKRLDKSFPDCLHEAPMLMPGEDFAVRKKLEQWLNAQRLRPRIVGEFDDSALMKEFARVGAGIIAVPSAIAQTVALHLDCVLLGRVESLIQQSYAITGERRMTHPAVMAISKIAKQVLFSAGT